MLRPSLASVYDLDPLVLRPEPERLRPFDDARVRPAHADMSEQRAVIVIDRNGRVAYAEYVPDQMKEPDYASAVEAAHRAANA